MSSAQSTGLGSKKTTTIDDLPAEIITLIYEHLDTASSITALSSTCNKYHIVWLFNAASISSAAIYDNIPCFSLALELQEVQEKVRGVDFTTSPPPTARLRTIQQKARDKVGRYQTEGYRGISLSNGDYNTTIVRTQTLLSIAKKASHVGAMYTKGLLPNADLTNMAIGMSCEDFLSAFYRVWILATLRLGETIREQLESIEDEELDNMMAVIPGLAIDCSTSEKIYLGIGHPGILPETTYPRITFPNSNCPFNPDWLKAMLEISECHGGSAGMFFKDIVRGY